ncbi:MAG TPA: hypothetical protein VJ227_03290 [Patescibacteria group bacterium]|nr:hypothetical protein [Patescibacteria group bacterium]
MKAIYKIILLALVLRLVISFLGYHGDVNDFYWWAKELVFNGLSGFYDRNIANATQPIYPPVTSYLFWGAGQFHELFLKLLWFLNINISIFPSNLIFWMESPNGWFIFNKLPAILSDIGIIYVLYLFGRSLKNEKAGLVAASLFAFVPTFWYNSSLWGQTESVFALPMLGAFYLLHKNKIKSSIALYTLALLTKPTAFFAFPVFAFWVLRKGKAKEVGIGILYSTLLAIALYFPFHPEGIINWIISFYLRSLNGVLGYTVANAFNFWALIFGFDNRPDTSPLFGIPANIIGNTLFISSVAAVVYLFMKKKDNINLILLSAAVVSFAAFMFLPRMHERYFYPTLIFLIPLAISNKSMMKVFWAASIVHLINLFHFWWVPKVGFLVEFFSAQVVEKLLILFNIGIFFYLLYLYKKYYAKAR